MKKAQLAKTAPGVGYREQVEMKPQRSDIPRVNYTMICCLFQAKLHCIVRGHILPEQETRGKSRYGSKKND